MSTQPNSATASIHLDLLSSRVRIETAEPAWLQTLGLGFEDTQVGCNAAEIQLRIRLLPAPGAAQGGRWEVTTDPAGAFDDLAIPEPRNPAHLVSALNLWAVRQTDRHYVFHAAAVVRRGVGVLLPAASRNGKSTLTAAWVRRGAELLSDEVGAVELSSGALVGYPRALSLRRDVLPLLGLEETAGTCLGDDEACMFRVGALPGRRARSATAPRLIVLPRYLAGHRTQPRRLRPGCAAMGLLESSCSQDRFKEVGLDFVLGLARRLPCYSLTYSNLEEATAALDEMVTGLDPS